MAQTKRHKVFVSYHHDDDQKYKNRFVEMMEEYIVDKSLKDGDINDQNIKTAAVRQKIQKFIAGSTVAVVLIGPRTWQRKHVDWEIGSSIRKTKRNPRCGLLGVVLPNHSSYGKKSVSPRLIPPRLADNWKGSDPYALVYDWPNPWTPAKIAQWIHRAFVRRDGTPPNNSRKQFARNRTRDYRRGWQN